MLRYDADLPKHFLAEAMHHANWLRNRLPPYPIDGKVPLKLFDSNARLNMQHVLKWGQPGFAFIYCSQTQPQKKFLPRAMLGYFVGMHSDTKTYRVYVPSKNTIIFTGAADFKPQKKDELPDIATLLDGITRQRQIDEVNNVDSEAEEHLARNVVAFVAKAPHLCLSAKRKHARTRAGVLLSTASSTRS